MNASAPARTILLASLLAGCHPPAGTSAPPADDVAVEIAVAAIRGEDLARHVEVLASDDFAGRFPGEAGEAKTVTYIAAELSRLGVMPGAPHGFLQPVPLQRIEVQPGATLRVGADPDAPALQWGEDFLAWSDGPVHLTDRDLVFAGYGIVAPEYDWDDYAGVDVRGKIVLTLGGEPSATADEPARFEGDALSPHATPTAKVAAAAAAGAAAVLELRADGEHGIAWSTLATGAAAPKYALPDAPSTPRLELRGLLRADRGAAIVAAAGHSLDELRDHSGRRGFVAQPLGVRASVDLDATRHTVTSHNVVGWIRGRERPEETVVYTAHWDHVGVREHLAGDHIFNGAVDNATGTAALLTLAAAYAALPAPPRRSIVFVATTAEEQGLLGARYYVQHPVFPLRDTVAVINMDALFPFGETRGMTVVAMGSTELDPYFAEAARHTGRTLHPDPFPEAGAFFRSDHFPFAEQGVPAMFAVGGPSPDPDAGETVSLARFAEYVQQRYHQPADEYDARTWDMGGIVQDVEIYFRAGLALAQTDAFPNWRPDHPFRARRDAMRSGG
jgi:hypothetical protein